MSGAKAVWVRGGLAFFALASFALGAYILISPAGFFSWSWVNMGMAYNPHLMLDYGAMNLAAAVPLGAAAVVMTPVFVRTALASYAVWSLAHFLIHLHFRSHAVAHTSATEANLLVGVLGVGVVIPVVLLLLTLPGAELRGDQGEQRGDADEAGDP
ncbi:hypothetical protein ACFQVC_18625 [Streptomyces monticola]|uniref:DUF4383 domain-containing protein n=1 Tax=Streptomyces monticola TaxID=2666263 RepID=A0ABW2JK24_9ACTN